MRLLVFLKLETVLNGWVDWNDLRRCDQGGLWGAQERRKG